MAKTRKPGKATPPDIALYKDSDKSTTLFDRPTLISDLQRSSLMLQRMIDFYTELMDHDAKVSCIGPHMAGWRTGVVPPQYADMIHTMSAGKYYNTTHNTHMVWLVTHLSSNVLKHVKTGLNKQAMQEKVCHDQEQVAWWHIRSDINQLKALVKKNARMLAALARANDAGTPLYGLIMPVGYSPDPDTYTEASSSVTVVSNVLWINCDKCCTVFRTEESMISHRDGLKCMSNTYKKAVPGNYSRIYNVAVASAVSRGELPGVTVMTKPQMYAPEHIQDIQAMYYKLKPAGVGLVEFIKAAIGKQDA